ncbi:MAG: hypothetical protein ACYTGS_21550 [Planctomycetota bacterium]
MERYTILVGLACFFGVVGTAFGAEASGELGPEAIEARIRQHRMGELIVRAKPGAAVRVEQLRHEFWFGAALSSGAFSGRLSAEDQRRYEQTFLASFNAAVTENALKCTTWNAGGGTLITVLWMLCSRGPGSIISHCEDIVYSGAFRGVSRTG